jgi:hypothetical protein
VPTGWKVREDVAEVLVEELGFTPDEDYPTMFWRKGSCVWKIISATGQGVLTGRSGVHVWSVPFGSFVPTHIIVAAAREAIADCPEHGTRCEGHEPDVTVDGEVI